MSRWYGPLAGHDPQDEPAAGEDRGEVVVPSELFDELVGDHYALHCGRSVAADPPCPVCPQIEAVLGLDQR